jgi:hypothetical protein
VLSGHERGRPGAMRRGRCEQETLSQIVFEQLHVVRLRRLLEIFGHDRQAQRAMAMTATMSLLCGWCVSPDTKERPILTKSTGSCLRKANDA